MPRLSRLTAGVALRASGALLLVLLLSPAGLSPATAEGWEPPGWRKPPAPQRGVPGPATLPLKWALSFYRATVSSVDGERCPSHPTCSAYAGEALSRHGPLLGILLTAGRLESEADQAAFSPHVFVGGRWKVYAPVEDDLAFWNGKLRP